MSSDLREGSGVELEPKKSSGQILRHEIQEGRIAIRRPVGGLFLSGLSAGLDIGFSLFLIAVTKTQADGLLPRPVVALGQHPELMIAGLLALGLGILTWYYVGHDVRRYLRIRSM